MLTAVWPARAQAVFLGNVDQRVVVTPDLASLLGERSFMPGAKVAS